LNDPEVQGAATKIQAVFRGHKFRKEKTKPTADSSSTGDPPPPLAPPPPLSQPSAPPNQTQSTLADTELADLEKEFDPQDTGKRFFSLLTIAVQFIAVFKNYFHF